MKIAFLVIGIIALTLVPLVIFLYVRKVKKSKNLDVKTSDKSFSHELFSFWSHVVYFFIIFTLLVAGLILIPIGI